MKQFKQFINEREQDIDELQLETNPPDTIDELTQRLKQHNNIQELGKGSFAVAKSSSLGGPYIVKHSKYGGDLMDPAFFWLKYCKQHWRPGAKFLPQVRFIHEMEDNTFFCIMPKYRFAKGLEEADKLFNFDGFVEYLTYYAYGSVLEFLKTEYEINKPSEENAIYTLQCNYRAWLWEDFKELEDLGFPKITNFENYPMIAASIHALGPEWENVIQTLLLILRSKKNSFYDLHGRNYMVDQSGNLIITDPVAQGH